jgi:adenylate cyclase
LTAVVFADLVGSTGIFERLGDDTASRFVTGFTGALTTTFEEHHGRVVKLLGDGLFVVFRQEADALRACMAIQTDLARSPVFPNGDSRPVQVRMGLETGEVVDIAGDCFGDAVNCAARLSGLAGPGQILTTQGVRDAVEPSLQQSLRSLGPMVLRGKSGPSIVYRVQWQSDRDADATVMGRSMMARPAPGHCLSLTMGSRQVSLAAGGEPLSIGRALTNSLPVNDGRVSRLHATVEWRGDQFVLSDFSSFGTWVYLGSQTEPIVLRRAQCFLIGAGMMSLGCDAGADAAASVTFRVSAAG